MKKINLFALVVALLVIAAACGSSEETTDQSSEAGAEEDEAMEDDAMEDDAMSMGDVHATAASEVAGADLASADFQLLPTSPEGFEGLAGSADIARHDGGTTVTVEFDGLAPEVNYIAHLHEGSCADNGGPHFKFDSNGSDTPPNEIHLAFTSTADGIGFMTAENAQLAGENGRSVVVHEREGDAPKIACAELG